MFSYFSRKQNLAFHANCLHGDNLHEMSNPVFSGNNITNLSSAELAQRVEKVNSRTSTGAAICFAVEPLIFTSITQVNYVY